MADTKISGLSELVGSAVSIDADLLAIVDNSATATKKIFVSNLLGAAYNAAGSIVQASDDGVAAELTIGTARQVPTVNSGATALAYANPITLGTMQATTSGTEWDFPGIPAGVRRITVIFAECSLSGTDHWLVQLGDAGGFETSGYVSSSGATVDTAVSNVVNSTSGFIFYSGNAGYVVSGKMVIDLIDAATFHWVASHSGKMTTTITMGGGGDKSLSAELTQVRITRSGTNTGDAGAVNISYE